MKKVVIIVFSIIIAILVAILISILVYKNSISAVSNNKTKKEFVVTSGSTYYSIVNDLYNQKLIKSELGYKIYLKLNKPSKTLEAGTYYLSENMSVKEIIKILSLGGVSGFENTITITFKEGLNMRSIIKVITDNTSITEEEILNLLSNEEYLDKLVNDYWFIDESIKNTKLYYSLEGYLYPNTYQFKKDATIEDIFKTMLDEMDKKLTQYKKEINENSYNVHEILTLASVVELEAKSLDDRKGVAGVFFNRLYSNMSLGSDVTTYYASKVDMSERDLYLKEINEANDYNTRSTTMSGKLPVGPICNPSIDSIYAILKPIDSTYYYFVSDNTGKVYFANNYQGHNAIINELKEKGLWERY